MFIDTAKVTISAGKGGDGVVSFRHEIYVPKGGPDGGDGGRGGDVVFVATTGQNTLLDFRYQPKLEAENGVNGAKSNRRGASGKPLIVKVPVGTIVKKDDVILADLIQDGQEAVIAKGGEGGFGNAHFKSSTRQTPKIAEKGEPGESFEVDLELKLLADVGLVGFPNAGKSTFLSVTSNAKPEIADYPFTTLTPNLGIAKVDDGSLLIADIPGLIEGASQGKGLGDAFLRHVERTSVLLHMIDVYSDDVAKNYQVIRDEILSYSPDLAKRPEIVALTKVEGVDEETLSDKIKQLRKVIDKKVEIIAISSKSHRGVTDLLRLLRKKVEAEQAKAKQTVEEETGEVKIIRLDDSDYDETWEIEVIEESKLYKVSGKKIERFAIRTNFDSFEGVNRLRHIMDRFGITHELKRRGAKSDSLIQIADAKFTLVEQ